MVDFTLWRSEVEALLEELNEFDFGYPLQENCLGSPISQEEIEQLFAKLNLGEFGSLKSFFLNCDGLSWPDVHNGYFLKSIREFAKSNTEPNELTGEFTGEIVVIGSSGGGDLISLRRGVGDVIWMRPRLIEHRIYHAIDSGAQIVAKNFGAFAERLKEDLFAFVNCEEDYPFLA